MEKTSDLMILNEWRAHMRQRLQPPTKYCVICNQNFVGYGNNAAPVAIGCCCDNCNNNAVVPARIQQIVN